MKALFLGMSVATVVGLSAGGAMKPISGDFEGGPQFSFPQPARRAATPWADNASWTSYGANIPDYVIGTDWIGPQLAMASAADAAEAETDPPPPEAKAEPPPPPPKPEPAKFEERPAPQQHYPSIGGDILAGMDSYAPPTPPQDEPPEPPPAN